MARSRASVLGLALVLASCGGGGDPGEPSDPAGASCRPQDRGSGTPGELEATLANSLRENAGIEAVFGERTQAILDQVDTLRLEASAEALGMAGLAEPPEPPATPGLCASEHGLTAQAWAFRALGMSLGLSFLPELIDRIPFTGSFGGSAHRSAERGDPAVSMSYNAYFEGDGKSLVGVEMRGVADISSPAQGSIHEDTVTRASIDVCPDVNGHVKGKVHFQFSGIATPAGGDPRSYSASTDSEFRFEVDDDAEIAAVVIDSTMTYRTTGAAAIQLVARGSATFDQGFDRVSAADLRWEHRDGPLDAVGRIEREILTAAVLGAVITRDKAREKWRGGTCVEVRTDREGGSVPAGRPTTFVATARHKLEGRDIDAKIQGWLTGARSLSPNAQRVPSPATYEYTPGEEGMPATVHLETVSKRGIGRKDLAFTPAAARWVGTVRIQARADRSETMPYSTDRLQGTRTDFHREEYEAELTAEGSSLGILTLGGTIRASRSFGYDVDESGTGGGGCEYRLTESHIVSLSGTADPSQGFAQVSAGAGQFILMVMPPTVQLVGTDRLKSVIEPLTPDCEARPDIDQDVPRSESASHALQVQGAFDAATPVLAGSKEDPPDPETGLTVTYEWNLRLE